MVLNILVNGGLWLHNRLATALAESKSFQPQNTFFSIVHQTQKHCANKPAGPNLSSLPPESLIPLE
jgi:hypothetical protein